MRVEVVKAEEKAVEEEEAEEVHGSVRDASSEEMRIEEDMEEDTSTRGAYLWVTFYCC